MEYGIASANLCSVVFINGMKFSLCGEKNKKRADKSMRELAQL